MKTFRISGLKPTEKLGGYKENKINPLARLAGLYAKNAQLKDSLLDINLCLRIHHHLRDSAWQRDKSRKNESFDKNKNCTQEEIRTERNTEISEYSQIKCINCI